MSVLDLVRADLRDFGGYRSARSDRMEGSVWLNANESPWPNAADAASQLRRYPDPQPQRLREALAGLYGCEPRQLLAGRGSDEGIDLLVRALCRPGGDAGQGTVQPGPHLADALAQPVAGRLQRLEASGGGVDLGAEARVVELEGDD